MNKLFSIRLLPNTITLINLWCAFISMFFSMSGDYMRAAWFIVICGILDVLDGRFARLIGFHSKLGAELDSLSDIVAFGVAPAILAFNWTLNDIGTFGWPPAFVYLSCTAIRLAQFNVVSDTKKRFAFIGLPTPAAAGMILTHYWLFESLQGHFSIFISATPYLMLIVMTAVGFSMLAPIPYFHVKQFTESKVNRSLKLIIIIAFIGIVLTEPKWVLLTLAITYWLSGFIILVIRKQNKRK